MERSKILGYAIKIGGAVVGAAASAVGAMFISEKLGNKKEYAELKKDEEVANTEEQLAKVDDVPVEAVGTVTTSEEKQA